MMSRSKRNVVGLVEVVRERHAGMLDVLINNAGILDAGWQPLTSTSPDELEEGLRSECFRGLPRHAASAAAVVGVRGWVEDRHGSHVDVVALCVAEFCYGDE